jgi:hypothetical protein
MPQKTDVPQLLVLAPDAYRGRRIPLLKDDMVVGREASCDVRFDDPYVSRAHAVLRRRGSAVYVQDLDSSAGTLVNGTAAGTARELQPGDVVALADVRLRFEPASVEPAAATLAGTPARYDIGQQHGGIINNIGRDQYNAYVQQREGFLREVAATRTKARWLIWIGFLCFVAGFALFASGILGFISQVTEGLESGNPQPPDDIFGRDIGGIPAGLLGWALAAVGSLLALIGIVLHVVATSRRKRVDRELPVPPPWRAPAQ